MATFIMLPGIGGSGATHWQTHWEAGDPCFTRFQPGNWDRPDLTDWLGALEDSIARAKAPPVLVAHSLACLLVAHAAPRIAGRVKGAFLVAVPDPASPVFPQAARPLRRSVPAGLAISRADGRQFRRSLCRVRLCQDTRPGMGCRPRRDRGLRAHQWRKWAWYLGRGAPAARCILCRLEKLRWTRFPPLRPFRWQRLS